MSWLQSEKTLKEIRTCVFSFNEATKKILIKTTAMVYSSFSIMVPLFTPPPKSSTLIWQIAMGMCD